MSDELRQDIAGAIYDATGLRGEAWATASDVADEYVLANAVLAVVQPLVDERDRLKDEAVHYIAQRLALDEVAKHADALRVERDRLLWLHAEAVWNWRHLADRYDHALERERALRASAVVLPEDWRKLVGECESSGAAVDLVESWLPVAVQAGPPDRIEWCVFYGGTDPYHSAGFELYDDEADATEHVQLYEQPAGVAKRTVRRGRWEITQAAGVSGTGTEASKAAAAPSPDVDRETLVEVLSRDHAEINALWDEDPDDYWRTLADRLIAAGYICTPGHEWQCPGCGATTRARMADYPTEQDGAAQIVAERHRVVTAKGYDAAHDDHHVHGELLDAARCYFNQGLTYFAEHTNAFGIDAYSMYDQNWPWWSGDQPAGWKPSSSPVRNLVKAGQFIAAEIDRLQRAGLSIEGGEQR